MTLTLNHILNIKNIVLDLITRYKKSEYSEDAYICGKLNDIIHRYNLINTSISSNESISSNDSIEKLPIISITPDHTINKLVPIGKLIKYLPIDNSGININFINVLKLLQDKKSEEFHIFDELSKIQRMSNESRIREKINEYDCNVDKLHEMKASKVKTSELNTDNINKVNYNELLKDIKDFSDKIRNEEYLEKVKAIYDKFTNESFISEYRDLILNNQYKFLFNENNKLVIDGNISEEVRESKSDHLDNNDITDTCIINNKEVEFLSKNSHDLDNKCCKLYGIEKYIIELKKYLTILEKNTLYDLSDKLYITVNNKINIYKNFTGVILIDTAFISHKNSKIHGITIDFNKCKNILNRYFNIMTYNTNYNNVYYNDLCLSQYNNKQFLFNEKNISGPNMTINISKRIYPKLNGLQIFDGMLLEISDDIITNANFIYINLYRKHILKLVIKNKISIQLEEFYRIDVITEIKKINTDSNIIYDFDNGRHNRFIIKKEGNNFIYQNFTDGKLRFQGIIKNTSDLYNYKIIHINYPEYNFNFYKSKRVYYNKSGELM